MLRKSFFNTLFSKKDDFLKVADIGDVDRLREIISSSEAQNEVTCDTYEKLKSHRMKTQH